MVIYYAILLLLPLSLVATLMRRRSSDLLVLTLAAASTMAISGLRWESDVDHPGYAEMYEETPDLASFSPDSIRELHGEPGYLLVSSALKALGVEFYALSFLCALFALGAKAFVANRFTSGGSLAFCLYLCTHFITIEFIQIRWAVASALIGLAFWNQYTRRLGMAALYLALAVAFHYFAAVFVLVALLVELRSDRLFYVIVLMMSVTGALLAWDWPLGVVAPELPESDVYVLERATRYLSDPLSHVGVLSYLRLAAFPVLYFLVNAWYQTGTDEVVAFLRRAAFASIGVTLLVSFVPLMHFRAVAVADVFSLLLVVRLLERRVPAFERATALAVFTGLYAIWYVMDVRNYVTADLLYEYKSWLRFVI